MFRAKPRLRLIHDRSLLNLAERLSKEVKRRLKDFDLYFPCRCHTSFRHVKTWLEAWRGYYNWIRYHTIE
jgi:transposase-like protein